MIAGEAVVDPREQLVLKLVPMFPTLTEGTIRGVVYEYNGDLDLIMAELLRIAKDLEAEVEVPAQSTPAAQTPTPRRVVVGAPAAQPEPVRQKPKADGAAARQEKLAAAKQRNAARQAKAKATLPPPTQPTVRPQPKPQPTPPVAEPRPEPAAHANDVPEEALPALTRRTEGPAARG